MKRAAITIGVIVFIPILGTLFLNGCERLNEYRFNHSMRDPHAAKSIRAVTLKGQGLRIQLTDSTRDAFARALQKAKRQAVVEDFTFETGPVFICRLEWSDWITTTFTIGVGKEGALLTVGDAVNCDYIIFNQDDKAALQELIKTISPHPPVPGDYEL